jgi:hypothetical protein
MVLHAVVIISGLIEMFYNMFLKNLSEGSEIVVKLYLSP